MTGTYNGWPNRSTWNVNLWLTGVDEATYHEARRVARAGTVRDAASALKLYCYDLWGRKTPDGDSLAPVRWTEIAKALRE
jgi:hypothetical protein